jgi:hypothetical protein
MGHNGDTVEAFEDLSKVRYETAIVLSAAINAVPDARQFDAESSAPLF